MKHVLVYGMTDNPGGLETYIVNFFRRVQGKDVWLDFLTDFDTVAYQALLEERGARIYPFPPKSQSLWKHWRILWRLLREHKEYTAVYFNILDAGAAVTMLVPFLLGRRVVVHSHNNDTEKKRLHRLCRPLLNCLASGRAACSDSAAAYMFGRRAAQALVIPNAIDAKRYAYDPTVRAAKRAELGLGGRFAVCHVGRLSAQKNPLFLLDVMEKLRETEPTAVLLHVGEGDMAEEFDAYAQKKGLEDAVCRLGTRHDIPELLQAADAFLFPSLYEGLGIALLEAQAAGLPCVISDVIPARADVTDLVRRVSLSAPAERWASELEAAKQTPRADTFDEFVRAGFDISCCGEYDQKLMEKF